MNHELPDVQAGFRKGRGTRDQIANIRWIIEKAREFQKIMFSFSLVSMHIFISFLISGFLLLSCMSCKTIKLLEINIGKILCDLGIYFLWLYD